MPPKKNTKKEKAPVPVQVDSDTDTDIPIVATKKKGYVKKNKIVFDSDSDSDTDLKIKTKSNQEANPEAKQEAKPEELVANISKYTLEELKNYLVEYTGYLNTYALTNNSNAKLLDVMQLNLNKLIEDIEKLRTQDVKNLAKTVELKNTHELIQKQIKKLETVPDKINVPNEPKQEIKAKPVIKANSIDTLIPLLTNEHQVAILNRIKSDSEYARVYLQNYEPNEDKKKKTLKGTIKILGNYNRAKGIREGYEVKVFENDPKGSFWCSCADHKFNSAKKNIVCKHICFIACKVLKILDTGFFETKTLTPSQLEELLNKFNVDSEMWKDKKIVRTSNKVTIQDFKNFTRPVVDTCSFCYDEMTDADIPVSCSCPLCKHCFHEECMGVWLESQTKCSFCSNDYWKYYKRIIAGEKEINLGSSQL